MTEFYAYTLAYPPQLQNGRVFYVGKGCGPRMHLHEVNAASGERGPRADTIRAIWNEGYQIVKAVALRSEDEEAVLAEEARLIAFYGRDTLVNQTDGASLSDEAVRRRFWSKVDKTGPCWLWTGAKSVSGAGVFFVGSKALPAHHVAWALIKGELPSGGKTGLCIHDPACVCPDHPRPKRARKSPKPLSDPAP